MNNTLQNGLNVLEFLSGSTEPHSVKELSDRMKLPKSHICRLLKTLKDVGYVCQNDERKYYIGLKILCLSNGCLRRMGLRLRLRPFLDKLANELDREIYLQVPHGVQAMVVDVVCPKGVIRDSSVEIGCINPVNYTAGGKICAAYSTSKELDAHVRKYGLKKMTDKTITDYPQFKAELEQIRRGKIAKMDSERIPGLAAVASPVFDCNGSLAAVIGAVLPEGGHTGEQWSKFKKSIYETAEASSYALGYALYKLK
ncbi:MAG: IclR family transcriptional regulator [Victivallales bacterium]|jgi:DNA-binding IclR family transcriptional regulator